MTKSAKQTQRKRTMQVNRKKKRILSLAIDPTLHSRLDDWLAARHKGGELRTTKTAVVEAAIQQYLDGTATA